MKPLKILLILCLMTCLCINAGCSKRNTVSKEASSANTQAPISSADIRKDIEAEQEKKAAQADQTVDIDLTVQSTTMVFAEVSNMTMKPKEYAGKTIKINGRFTIFSNEGKNYFVVIVKDAPGCCQQGIAFILESGSQNSADYPAPDSDITVIGTLSTEANGAATYCQMINAKIV